MLEDLRKKLQMLRQEYADDLDRLIDRVKNDRITGEEYRAEAAVLRARYFEDDKLVHAEIAERVKPKPPEIPDWLNGPLKE